MNLFEYVSRDTIMAVLFAVLILLGICTVVYFDWTKPSTWRCEVPKMVLFIKFGLVLSTLLWGAFYGLIFRSASSISERGIALSEFQTGLVEALERISLVAGGQVPFRPAEGSFEERSRYTMLYDEGGPVVRVSMADAAACSGTMASLSDYALASLRVQDGRPGMADWRPLGTVEETCNLKGASVGMTFRSSTGM